MAHASHGGGDRVHACIHAYRGAAGLAAGENCHAQAAGAAVALCCKILSFRNAVGAAEVEGVEEAVAAAGEEEQRKEAAHLWKTYYRTDLDRLLND